MLQNYNQKANLERIEIISVELRKKTRHLISETRNKQLQHYDKIMTALKIMSATFKIFVFYKINNYLSAFTICDIGADYNITILISL